MSVCFFFFLHIYYMRVTNRFGTKCYIAFSTKNENTVRKCRPKTLVKTLRELKQRADDCNGFFNCGSCQREFQRSIQLDKLSNGFECIIFFFLLYTFELFSQWNIFELMWNFVVGVRAGKWNNLLEIKDRLKSFKKYFDGSFEILENIEVSFEGQERKSKVQSLSTFNRALATNHCFSFTLIEQSRSYTYSPFTNLRSGGQPMYSSNF